jgi:hypothetical protein
MTIVDRFLSKVTPVPFCGCWLWLGAIQVDTGYGRFGMPGNTVDYAHRASWRIFIGEIPARTLVCHECDVRSCVNPQHLFLGTYSDNMQDASRKGRVILPVANFASSDAHQVAKLTNDQVRAIRSSALGAVELAKMYEVGRRAIWAARTGKTFRDVQ